MYGLLPGPAVMQPLLHQHLGELLLSCSVSHRIAPGEFLSGGLYVQAPVQFHPSSPSSSAPEGPIVARPSRSVKIWLLWTLCFVPLCEGACSLTW